MTEPKEKSTLLLNPNRPYDINAGNLKYLEKDLIKPVFEKKFPKIKYVYCNRTLGNYTYSFKENGEPKIFKAQILHDKIEDRTEREKQFRREMELTDLLNLIIPGAVPRIIEKGEINLNDYKQYKGYVELGIYPKSIFYFMMERLEGGTYDDLDTDIISLGRISAKASRILGILSYMGFVHGDIKPANIFLTKDDNPRIGDLGGIKALNEMTSRDSLFGTPGFISPVQLKLSNGNFDDYSPSERNIELKKIDAFAFGSTMLHKLQPDTDEFFYKIIDPSNWIRYLNWLRDIDKNIEISKKTKDDNILRINTGHEKLDEIIFKSLKGEYGSCLNLADDLEKVFDSESFKRRESSIKPVNQKKLLS